MSSNRQKDRLVRAEYPTLEPDKCHDCEQWNLTEEFYHERKRKYVDLCSACTYYYELVEL